MGLSNELISQFAKITNDKKTSRIDEVTLYGEVVEYNDMICVKFDGSEEITPVTTVVEKDEDGNVINYKYGAASVKTGDRVSVNLKNHSATITGNLTDPPPSRAEVVVDDNSILARVDDVSVKIDNLGVKVNGITEFTNGLENGTTSIDGGCIKTGKIDAEHLNLTGAIKFGDLADDAAGKINDAADAADAAQGTADSALSAAGTAQSTANGAQSTANSALSAASTAQSTANNAQAISNQLSGMISNWSYNYGGTTYIDGSKIMTGTVTASSLRGGNVQLLDTNGWMAALFTLSGSSSYQGRKLVVASGAIELNGSGGAVYISGQGGSTYLQLSTDVACRGNFRPDADGGALLGDPTHRWNSIYSTSGIIQTSDEVKKKDIKRDLTEYDSFFDSLVPCAYKFIDGESGRIHLGMISQDVEKALESCGISSMDFAGFVKSPREDEEGTYDYALRYAEFIPLLVWQVQKLKARVAELEETNG